MTQVIVLHNSVQYRRICLVDLINFRTYMLYTDFKNLFINELNYIQLYLLTFVYFILIYFLMAFLFQFLISVLSKKKFLNRIIDKKIKNGQVKSEILHSIISMSTFGLATVIIILIFRKEYNYFLADNLINILITLIILNVYNEIHFYLIHRLMHIPFFWKNVHHIHHRSSVPTVFSVFNFHLIEALLLSLVPVVIFSFCPLSLLGIFLYPISSLLLNMSGHCNYRFGSGDKHSNLQIGTKHALHHDKNNNRYGFATSLLDKLFSPKN